MLIDYIICSGDGGSEFLRIFINIIIKKIHELIYDYDYLTTELLEPTLVGARVTFSLKTIHVFIN